VARVAGGRVRVARVRALTLGFETERLRLRDWRPEDRAPFAALNADPEVMFWFPAPMSRAESDVLADRIQAGLDDRGWGLWAVERIADQRFLGFTGLAPVDFEAPFTPAVEIGWRLARSAWGEGYATEAARRVVRHAFEAMELPELVSFTAVGNERSWRVMERLGMRRDGEFDHPRVPDGHPLRRHVLYRLSA
jgi:RimJ/RimL family protein N-acetyltransferase